jgi:dienelactone hydrolase
VKEQQDVGKIAGEWRSTVHNHRAIRILDASGGSMTKMYTVRTWIVVAVFLFATAAHSEAPPIATFARDRFIADAAISPDGRYLAVITTISGVRVAMVRNLSTPNAPLIPVMSGATDYKFFITWCRWATDSRLLCGLRGTDHVRGMVVVLTRLAAVDADGKNLKVLLQDNAAVAATGQIQDHIVDWTPGIPDTVLIQAQADLTNGTSHRITASGGAVVGNVISEFPSLYELNVVTGKMRRRLEGHRPLRAYLTDHHGEARLGWGVMGETRQIVYDARDPRTGDWNRLLKYEAFSNEHVLRPISICADKPDCAYAIGSNEGRDALWRLDLTGKNPPALEFAHPIADVEDAVFANDGRLLGVMYETDQPFIYYTDPTWGRIARSLKAVLPNTFIELVDATRDERLYLVRASSDVDAGTYYLLDAKKGQLERVGKAYPDLDPATVGRMQTISYPSRDGTTIPGYLTVPPGVRAEHLRLVVMPHGGPIARDSWQFDFLRAFLVSRGYAVLQMNFRGSAGYGEKWFYDAHQDWGGLTYSDIVDGARWAVKEGIADPSHMCIVGWSFGGYAALLGATRNGDLFRCAVSIAGVSDLKLLETQASFFVGGRIAREQIGTDSSKLKADSPRSHAADVSIPVLMVHGDNDAQANVDQSDAMDRALTRAGKAHEYILIEGADHQMSRESDRTTLLTAIERFLATHLAGGSAHAQ